MSRLTTILLALVLLSPCASATIIRVPQDRPTIQAAIDVAHDGDTVLLADGTHVGHGNLDVRFRGKMITLRSANGPEHCRLIGGGWLYGLRVEEGEGRHTVIQGLTISEAGTGIRVRDASPTIIDCVFDATFQGFLIEEDEGHAHPHIDRCRIIDNEHCGIRINEGQVLVTNTEIRGCGESLNYGHGGIYAREDCTVTIDNCLLVNNTSLTNGGGIDCAGSLYISNCTIAGNHAETAGGGICIGDSMCYMLMENCIVAGNSADIGDELALFSWSYFPSEYYISYTDVVGETWVDAGCMHPGPGVITDDPMFTSGPLGNYYLCQTAAGQSVDSPCVDAGDPDSPMIYGTTRTDHVYDGGVIDMGCHFRDPSEDDLPDTRILSGPGGVRGFTTSPVVAFSFTGSDPGFAAEDLTYSWRLDDGPWSAWSPGTWATVGDLVSNEYIYFEVRARDPQGDVDPSPARHAFYYREQQPYALLDRLVIGAGPGPGNPPVVRTSLAQWLAYGVARYGVNVAAGDIDGDGVDEVITGPGPGAMFGPHVRCFRGDGTVVPNAWFMAYGTLKYGVNVAAGDIDGDGIDEIITGAGPGAVFGPHVRGWNWDGGPQPAPIPGVSYFAYGTLRWGVNVACGDINGDGIDEIVTGPGPGEIFGAHVRGWRYDGSATSPLPHVSWLAYSPHLYGVNVACGDLDGDGRDEIITGIGPGADYGPRVRAWDVGASSVTQMPGVDFRGFPHSRYGVSVGAADLEDDGIAELMIMPGPGLSNQPWLRGWEVHGGEPELSHFDFIILDRWLTHGGNVAGSENGWE